MNLSGKNAVVVGGATGWGRDAAQRLAMDGARIFVVDRDAARVDRCCDGIRRQGNIAEAVVSKTDSPVDLRRANDEIMRLAGQIHILVTHFPVNEWTSCEEIDTNTFAERLRFQVVGPLVAVQTFLPGLKLAGGASVIHIGSIDGLMGNPRLPAYSVAKGALIPMTHMMAHDFARYEIRVNLVATAVTTQPVEDAVVGKTILPAAYMRQLANANPLKRYGNTADWAGTVSFLASTAADCVTGSVAVVDSGRTAITPGTAWQQDDRRSAPE